ncbi:electron transport complex subunit RsxB [Pseudomonas sp. 2FE]|uniref:electron transport complex subunit RsxB n=1 Tax=Pseudomonas sp. 2FE TaxID=2502190 RepID=UPI003555E512
MSSLIRIEAIDALLPQTQCGKCGHPGCKPYARAIAEGEAINKCPPGGVATIQALAELLDVPVLPPEIAPIAPQIAFIREAECIGCTKCIQACPVDAIVGAAKQMHTVLVDECTGCELCVAPCPVDCIDILPLPEPEAQAQRQRADQFRLRFETHQARLEREEARKQAERQARVERAAQPQTQQSAGASDPVQAAIERVKAQKAAAGTLTDQQKRLKIEAAMAQVALSKAEKQLATHGTPALEAQVAELRAAAVAAQAALQAASPAAPASADEAALKKAKIALAVRRTELKSAERNGVEETELMRLRAALSDAEQALHAAEEASGKPPPELVRIDKQPVDTRLRALKTELAYARAEVSKLERRSEADADALTKARARLAEAERQLHEYAPV